MKHFAASLCALAIGGSALFLLQSAGTGPVNERELWRHRNLGKALFETPTTLAEASAELKKALDLAPDSFRDRLNYGLALLRSGDRTRGIVELQKAQKQNPSVPHTWFNLGIAYKHERRYPEAIRQFEHMVELTPDEPVSHYNLGLLYGLTGRAAEALKQFEIAAKLDPKLVAPRFQIYNHHRLGDDDAAARLALADFRQAKAQQKAADDTEDMEWCFYAELYDPAQAHPAARDASSPAALQFDDRILTGTVDAKGAGMLVLDANGDGNPDLLVWSRTGILLYRRGSAPVADTGLADLTDVISVAAGDFDNDGLPDLCVLTEAGARLYHNTKGRFEPKEAPIPAGRYESAVWLDFDHDYDLDLFLLGENSVLLRNEGEAGFADYTAHFPFAHGHAISAAAFRVVPDTKGIDLAVSYADRKGMLYRDQLRGVFQATALDAIPAGAAGLNAVDLDNDGWIDFAFRTRDGISLVMNRRGEFEPKPTAAFGPFVFSDLENRGLSDLIAGDAVYRNQGLGELMKSKSPAPLSPAVAWTHADFDADGRDDIAAVAPDGSLHLLLNRTSTANQWLRVALTGVKNLKMAEGAEVEVKAGEHYQKQVYQGTPLVFGLGANKLIDTVRISWPNGLIQNEPNQPVARAALLKEAPRLSGSCPMIFTWNGREFQFITDVLGVAPLGASSGGGNYFPVDHDEYVQIPAEALAPVDEHYEVRITEELHEVSYLDQVRLIALDHPRALEIFTNEKFKSPPFPEFRLFGVSTRIAPVAAHDDQGRDVLASILRRDGVYAGGFRHNYAGVAELHSLTLDLGHEAARDNQAVLFLNGWVDWADGSTFLGASQGATKGLVLPYLQVKDESGQWRTAIADMGIPAGKPKTIAVDLSGKFLSASREVRIVTNLCVYWDEIFFSEQPGPPPVRFTPLDVESADVRLRGFSRAVVDPRREHPESFAYARWTSEARWNQTPGLYTRYGDVRELVNDADDRFVIMGSGDELRLQFANRGLPSLAPNWRRDFLLLVDGWAKDSDANTAFSQTVEPLPFHSMSRYPYPAAEHYPDDASHQAYRRKYNSRPAIRFVHPLIAASR
ncbi:MAG: FG-GAP-like repeat-containing protein [Acidobacteriia bacterium]|nr:FG-GAP-like repeat-containing protein [Terriglobia bacterium]